MRRGLDVDPRGNSPVRWLYDPSQSAIDADRVSTAYGAVSTGGITVFVPGLLELCRRCTKGF